MSLDVPIRACKRAVPVIALTTYLFSAIAFGQTLVALPNCGEAGKTKVCVTGSGWAEPSPVCRYKFFFDGAQVVFPDQPDGLFGPPRRSFIVPGGAASGNHTIRVELRLNSPDTLLQAKEIPFKVVAAPDLSAETAFNGSTATGGSITIKFTPPCDVSPCTTIRFIQVVNNLGQKADGTTRGLTYTEMGFPNAADYDTDLSGSFKLDRIWGKTVPYYGVPGGPSTPGSDGGSPTPATMSDSPGIPDSKYPADIVKIIWEFEAAAFCAAGDGRARYLGKLLWKWERPKGGAATATIAGKSREQPSQNFINALNKWNANPKHPFTLPSPKFPPCP